MTGRELPLFHGLLCAGFAMACLAVGHLFLSRCNDTMGRFIPSRCAVFCGMSWLLVEATRIVIGCALLCSPRRRQLLVALESSSEVHYRVFCSYGYLASSYSYSIVLARRRESIRSIAQLYIVYKNYTIVLRNEEDDNRLVGFVVVVWDRCCFLLFCWC